MKFGGKEIDEKDVMAIAHSRVNRETNKKSQKFLYVFMAASLAGIVLATQFSALYGAIAVIVGGVIFYWNMNQVNNKRNERANSYVKEFNTQQK